jgi:hypothetical protein
MSDKNPRTPDYYTSIFHMLYPDTGEGILFAYSDLKIANTNDRLCQIYKTPYQRLLGSDCRSLVATRDRQSLNRALKNIGEHISWTGRLNGLRDETQFPIKLTVKRVPIERNSVFSIVIRDLTPHENLKEELRHEKANRREMYITIRNMMKAFERERSGIETGVSHKVETLLIPALEKIKNENSADIRNSYLELLQDQLINLTRGFSKELDGRFLNLTRSEMLICSHIQSGRSSKEIAEKMGTSLETVQTHRRNIRKKLGLKRRRINLYSFLSSKPFLQHIT